MSTHAQIIEEVASKSEGELEKYFNTIRNLSDLELDTKERQRPKSPEQKAIDRFKFLDQKYFLQGQDETRSKATEYYDLINKNQYELFNQHRVLMIRVAYDGKADDSYFQECVQLVETKTSHIRLIIKNVDESAESIQEMQTIRSFFWNWVPNTIIGLLRPPLYWLRTFFIVMSCYRYHRDFKPTLIFVDAHPIAVPLLKSCFSCPVVALAYYQNVPLRKKAAQTLPVPQARKSIYNTYLKYADQVFVPSMTIGKDYYKQMKRIGKFPIVFYPPVNGGTVHGERYTPRPNIMLGRNCTEPTTILFIAKWSSTVQFDLALIALQDFYLNLDEMQQERMKFVLLGFLDANDKEAIECRQKIINNMNDLQSGFREHLWYYTNPTTERLWKFYRDCIGVLHMSDDEEFSWPLLECQYFGRPAVCLKSPFSREIIKHGVNGFLVEADPYEASEYLCYIYSWVGDTLAKNCNENYNERLSRKRRSKIIDNAMMKFLPCNDANVIE